MSKRARKVAFDEEVDLADKRRREDQYENEERGGCALIGNDDPLVYLFVNQQSHASKPSTLLIATKRMSQILCRRVALEMKTWRPRKTAPL